MLEQIRIVLVNPSHPGNIGSVARAMKTMGLSNLYLVKPKKFPHTKALELAAGADDILTQAVISDNLVEALAGCSVVIGTSARPRGIPVDLLTPEQAADKTISVASQAPVAIIFGREHAGLTNEELLLCHYHVNIPTSEDYYSLNLAASVQIICYEIRKCYLVNQQTKPSVMNYDERARVEEVEQFYQHLAQVLAHLDFYDPTNPKRLMPRIRRMFNRIHLEKMEIRILRGMLSAIRKYTP